LVAFLKILKNPKNPKTLSHNTKKNLKIPQKLPKSSKISQKSENSSKILNILIFLRIIKFQSIPITFSKFPK
jgi:hypothetical protein